MKNIHASINWPFLLPLLLLVAFRLPFLWPGATLYPVHDTHSYAHVFFQFYREYVLHDELPLWSPLTYYGVTTFYDLLYGMTPSQYLVAWLGKGWGATDALGLFQTGLLLEEVVFLTGIHVLARTLFHRPAVIFLMGVAAVASQFPAMQLHWNFRIYYLVPFMIWSMIRLVESGHGRYVSILLLLPVVSLIGNISYFAPIHLLLIMTFLVALMAAKRTWPRFQWATFLEPVSLLLLALLLLVTTGTGYLLLHAFDDTVSLAPLRHQDRTVPLEVFLSYGTSQHANLTALAGFLTPQAQGLDWTLYLGPGMIYLALLSLGQARRQPRLMALWVTAGVLLLATLPATGIPWLLYHLFPGMKYFRHVEHLRPLCKVLLILLAGYGLEAMENRARLVLAVTVLTLAATFMTGEGMIPVSPPMGHDLSPWALWPPVLASLVILLLLAHAGTSWWGPVLLTLNLAGFQGMLISAYALHLKDLPPDYRGPFQVRPIPFAMTRQIQPVQTARELAPSLLHPHLLVHYYRLFATLDLDPCSQPLRVDYLPRGVHHLLWTWLESARYRNRDILVMLLARLDPQQEAGLTAALACGYPKLYLTDRVVLTSDEEQAVAAIRSWSNLASEPVVTGEPLASWTGNPMKESATGQLVLGRHTANQVEVLTENASDQGNWLIYVDAHHPGWQVTVDGESRPLYLANLAFKAVYLPPGHHRVRFEFVGHGSIALNLLFGLSVAAAALHGVWTMRLMKNFVSAPNRWG